MEDSSPFLAWVLNIFTMSQREYLICPDNKLTEIELFGILVFLATITN